MYFDTNHSLIYHRRHSRNTVFEDSLHPLHPDPCRTACYCLHPYHRRAQKIQIIRCTLKASLPFSIDTVTVWLVFISSCSDCLSKEQTDMERCAFTRCTLNIDGAVMNLNDLFCQVQTDAVGIGIPAAFIEAFKDMFQCFLIHSFTGIFDHKICSQSCSTGPDPDFSAFRCMFDAVFQDIGNCFRQPVLICLETCTACTKCSDGKLLPSAGHFRFHAFCGSHPGSAH